jgi:hypothetical protein
MVNATSGGVSKRHLPSSRPSLSKVVPEYYVPSNSGLMVRSAKRLVTKPRTPDGLALVQGRHRGGARYLARHGTTTMTGALRRPTRRRPREPAR